MCIKTHCELRCLTYSRSVTKILTLCRGKNIFKNTMRKLRSIAFQLCLLRGGLHLAEVSQMKTFLKKACLKNSFLWHTKVDVLTILKIYNIRGLRCFELELMLLKVRRLIFWVRHKIKELYSQRLLAIFLLAILLSVFKGKTSFKPSLLTENGHQQEYNL